MYTFSLIDPLDGVGRGVWGSKERVFLHQSLGGYVGATPPIYKNTANFTPHDASWVEDGFASPLPSYVARPLKIFLTTKHSHSSQPSITSFKASFK